MAERWMVYGASGYTGRLIAGEAVRRGMSPLLAGRSREKLAQVAGPLGLEARAVGLDDADALRAALDDVALVLHAAGPFADTFRPMVEACLATGTHYLDITGEIEVFEAIFALGEEAARAGVALLPGVGFDVVPTDCLAAMLASRVPDATHLELAIFGLGSLSRGTLRTIVRQLPRGGAVRSAGKIRTVPAAWRTREVPFADRTRQAVTAPWGDVATAFHSTGIREVAVYMALPPGPVAWMRRADRLRAVLGTRLAQGLFRAVIGSREPGPDETARREGLCQIWGEVRNDRGTTSTATLTTPEGYSLTVDAALCAVARVLRGIPGGAWTPSRAFGVAFLRELRGVSPGLPAMAEDL